MGQNLANGVAIAPLSGEHVFLAGPVQGAHIGYAVTFQAPVASSVEIYTHPLKPGADGAQPTYYPNATQLAIATAAAGPGDTGVLIPATPGDVWRQQGISIISHDPATLYLSVDAFSEGWGEDN